MILTFSSVFGNSWNRRFQWWATPILNVFGDVSFYRCSMLPSTLRLDNTLSVQIRMNITFLSRKTAVGFTPSVLHSGSVQVIFPLVFRSIGKQTRQSPHLYHTNNPRCLYRHSHYYYCHNPGHYDRHRDHNHLRHYHNSKSIINNTIGTITPMETSKYNYL